MTIETIKRKGFTLEIEHDPHHDESPREYEESTFFGFHNRVVSPDPAPDADPQEARRIAESPENVCLPVYMYDHGARIYKASADGNPFHCPWDSGLFGFIYISRADARRMYAISRLTESYRQKLLKDLAAQVEAYSQWANGELYSWTLIDPDGDPVDSCGGYYSLEDARTCGKGELSAAVQTELHFEEDCAA